MAVGVVDEDANADISVEGAIYPAGRSSYSAAAEPGAFIKPSENSSSLSNRDSRYFLW